MSSFDFDLAGGILFVFWFYAGTIAIAALAIGFFFYRRSRNVVGEDQRSRREVSLETADELGAPPDEVDPDEAFKRDREAGVNRPRVAPPEGGRRLRTDNLSKEVEVAWEAGDVIDFNWGARNPPEGTKARGSS